MKDGLHRGVIERWLVAGGRFKHLPASPGADATGRAGLGLQWLTRLHCLVGQSSSMIQIFQLAAGVRVRGFAPLRPKSISQPCQCMGTTTVCVAPRHNQLGPARSDSVCMSFTIACHPAAGEDVGAPALLGECNGIFWKTAHCNGRDCMRISLMSLSGTGNSWPIIPLLRRNISVAWCTRPPDTVGLKIPTTSLPSVKTATARTCCPSYTL